MGSCTAVLYLGRPILACRRSAHAEHGSLAAIKREASSQELFRCGSTPLFRPGDSETWLPISDDPSLRRVEGSTLFDVFGFLKIGVRDGCASMVVAAGRAAGAKFGVPSLAILYFHHPE